MGWQDDWDPGLAPDGEGWLALSEADRMSLVLRAHARTGPDALHADGSVDVMHGALHAIVETQLATGEPPIARETLARLEADGLRRHPAIHGILRVLVTHLAGVRGGERFDRDAYARDLRAITAMDVVAKGMRAGPGPDADEPAGGNRASRRSAAKARRKRT